jgi:hypothetical protein
MLFGTEDPYVFQKAKIALVSAARRRRSLNPAQLIQVMQLLYWRHPEIRMGVELLIKPGRSAFVGSHTQKIGLCIAINRPVRFLMTVGAGASFESPGPSHACNYGPLRIKKARMSKASCLFEGAMDRL